MRALLVFSLVFSFAVPVSAADLDDPLAGLNEDGTAQVDNLPESEFPTGKPCIAQEDGQRYQCFTLEEMKELKKWEAELAFFETGYYQLQEQTVLKDQKISLLEDENHRLTVKWTSENKLRLEAENKPKIGSAIAWTIAGVAVLGLAGLGAAYAVK